MKVKNNVELTNKEWTVIIKTEATDESKLVLLQETGKSRIASQVLISNWCKETLHSRNWATTRPYFNPAKMLAGKYSRATTKTPPMFFMFKNRSDASLMQDQFSHLFVMEEVTTNNYDGDDSVA